MIPITDTNSIHEVNLPHKMPCTNYPFDNDVGQWLDFIVLENVKEVC